MPPVRFEPAIPASGWLQTHALYRAATRIGYGCHITLEIYSVVKQTENV
jgi:hypothetical protein